MIRSLVTTSLALVGSVVVFASCAGDDEPEEAAPPGASSPDGAEASADVLLAADACDGPCRAAPIPCAEAAWCPTPAAIDPNHMLLAVWGSGKNDVLAVGSGGTILHWEGSAWTPVAAPDGVKNTFFSIWGAGPDDIWLGSSTSSLYHVSTAKQGELQFEVEPNLTGDTFSTPPIYAIWGSGGGDVRVGTARFPYDQAGEFAWGDQFARGAPTDRWQSVKGDAIVKGIWGSAANDVWIVADNGGAAPWQKGMTLHGTGRAPALDWAAVDSQSAVTLDAVWGSSATDVWAVGDAGTIRHMGFDTSRWEIVPSPTRASLHAIWGSGPSDVWAVGDEGTILYYDGATWKPSVASLPVGDKPALYGVWGSSADDVWIVGDGVVLHSTGKKVFGGGS